jgi:digeranylgeranylglycerophospholipid reductase
MQQSYDVVVVGAGPAGSVAAQRLAAQGFGVLLIEKRQEIGAPVRCAEAIGAESTRQFIPISDKWVNAYITHYSIHNQDGESIRVPPTEPTLVVDRKVFDWELAHQAAQHGATVRTRTQAEGLIIEDGRVAGVKLVSMGKPIDVRARLVIAADGTESQVARWAGLKTVPPMSDFYVGFQYLLGGLQGMLDTTTNQYHLGHAMSPGGYIWVFPKGADTANVGIVITADRAQPISAQTYLERFIDKCFPGASILGAVAGGIPATGALKKMVTDNLMAVGDAAHQADPLTAGGIGLGMMGADMAAQVAGDALRAGDLSAKRLSAYEDLWRARFGKMHKALYQIRKVITGMDDGRLNALIHTAATLPLETMTLGGIALALFRHHPRLLIEAQKLMTTGLILK